MGFLAINPTLYDVEPLEDVSISSILLSIQAILSNTEGKMDFFLVLAKHLYLSGIRTNEHHLFNLDNKEILCAISWFSFQEWSSISIFKVSLHSWESSSRNWSKQGISFQLSPWEPTTDYDSLFPCYLEKTNPFQLRSIPTNPINMCHWNTYTDMRDNQIKTYANWNPHPRYW